jgi:hypothetical protein
VVISVDLELKIITKLVVTILTTDGVIGCVFDPIDTASINRMFV